MLALAWWLVCPSLVGATHAVVPLLVWLGAATLVALIAWRVAPAAAALGPRGALRLGVTVALVGSVAGGAVAAWRLPAFGVTAASALGLSAVGAALCAGLVVTLAAMGWLRRERSGLAYRGRSVSLRLLLGGAAGTLAAAAWTLAAAHLVGRLDADAARVALVEARDLTSLAAERALVSQEIDPLPAALAPPGGYLVSLDDHDRVIGGVGAGLAAGTQLTTPAFDRCHVVGERRRELPCSYRRLRDGTIVVAAVPPRGVARGAALVFALAGLGAALIALGLGGLIGGGAARDLERLSGTLDALGRGRDLERPVLALSLDEVGELASAIAALRARLLPELGAHQAARADAAAAAQARDERLAQVAAALRTPLDRILAGARTLLDPDGAALSSPQKEAVRIVITAATDLSADVEELLDLGAIAAGRVALRLGEIDVGQLVGEVVKRQRPRAQEKPVDLRLTVEQPLPRLRGDERRLRQVVGSLVATAVADTAQGGVAVGVHGDGDELVLMVRDTGPGHAPCDLLRALDAVAVRPGGEPGHGADFSLGVCRRLVEAHGGRLQVESEPGVGSLYRVVLPLSGPPAALVPA